jgi:hypothetical protein
MSHTAPAPSMRWASKVTRLSEAMHRAWSEARYADRRLMEMRTNLSRHSG